MIKKVEGNIVDTIVEIFTVRYYEERSDDLNKVRKKGTDRNVSLSKCPLQQIVFQENNMIRN